MTKLPLRNVALVTFALAALAAVPIACSKSGAQNPAQDSLNQEATAARQLQNAVGSSAIVPADTASTVNAVNNGTLQVAGKARIGILYFLDQPAHRYAVLDWLNKNHATVLFEDQRFGYVDAEVEWKDLGAMIATVSNLGLDESSLLKLELENVEASTPADSSDHTARARAHASATGASLPDATPAPTGSLNSSFFGPVHSAGYGANVAQFRQAVATDLGTDIDHIAGQGETVAVFDAGIDMSRTDVFQNRVTDWVVGDERLWIAASTTLADFESAESATAVPAGLEDLQANATLRFASFEEKSLKCEAATQAECDLNGDGNPKDTLAFAVYEKDNHLEVRVRPTRGVPFGDAIQDFAQGQALGRPQIVNLYTGKLYVRDAMNPSPQAAAFKLRKDADGKLSVAMVGVAKGADHGISNLHMVGGDFTDETQNVHYQGVAPKVSFLGVQTWKLDGEDYGRKWLPLARGIIKAAEAKADVIDLDIYAPGARNGNDLLSKLLCRVTATTKVVPVVASHNYGPLPDTIQSLAQSPCVLGIGASHSIASLRDGRNEGSVDPSFTADDQVQTAAYSGRGFGMNGLYKPDVIAPAYGYTAYGAQFIRFGGTSGATPTTAGMIALLKQAALLKTGTELGFDQIKFLLQGSSRAPNAATPRDGYGNVDLAAAWELFKKHPDLKPFVLNGQQRLEFDGRPDHRILPLTLTRLPVLGSVNAPVPFKLWIEYGGASPAGSNWLKFYDTPSGTVSATLDKDMPMHGEQQKLNLVIDLPDDVWSSLPAGDHVAIVKGVRKDLADGRNVDFLLPVSFTKGMDVEETTFEVKPLYADQNQIFSFNANPGDRFFVSGQSHCLGQPVRSPNPGDAQTSIWMTIDNEATYIHASNVMNTYAAMYLNPLPTRVIAKKRIVRVNLVRYGQLTCNGALGGTITVRRSGFALGNQNLLVEQKDTNQEISLSTQVSTTGAPLLPAELNRGLQWKFAKKDAWLLLRKPVDGETSFVAPAGTRHVRVIPNDTSHFQAVLASVGKDGKTADQSSTQQEDSGAYTGGFGSISFEYNGAYQGLSLDTPDAGNTIHYVPTENDNKANAAAVIELEIDLPDSASAEVASSSAGAVTSWAASDSKPLALKAELPLSRPDALKDFADGWNTELVIEASIRESMADSNDNASYLPVDLWSSRLKAPVFFR